MDRTRQLVISQPSRALQLVPAVVLSIDVVLLMFTAALAIVGRERLDVFTPAFIGDAVSPVVPLIIAGWILTIAVMGGYQRDVFGVGTDEYKRVLRASLFTGGLVGVANYLAKFELSRGFFILCFTIGAVLLLAGRFTMRRMLYSARRRGLLQVRVVVAGAPAAIDETARALSRENWLGYSVVGGIVPGGELLEETAGGVPVLGDASILAQLASSHQADVIIFTGGSLSSAQGMKETLWSLEEQQVSVVIAPSLDDISHERITIRPVGGLPLIHVAHPTWADAGRRSKRIFDVVGASVLLAVLSPLFLYVALRVKINDGGPVLFRQTRTGRGGQEFACLKFRTMVVDAESRLAQLKLSHDATGGAMFKLVDDPRVTKPGKFLRRFSLDELPQLINVLKGDMSLVGPRPPLPSEVAEYQGATSRRLHVRPGMTGLWQVSGRSDLTWEEAVRLDLYYVDNWSMLQDLTILCRTVSAVMSSRGAY